MSDSNSFSKVSGSYGTAAVRALEKTHQTTSQQGRTREERIARLKEQVQSGVYVVDTVQLSSAIVNDLLNKH